MFAAVKDGVNVHTRINKHLLKDTDLVTVRTGSSRSQIINEALRRYLAPVARKKTTTKVAKKAKK